MQARQYLAAVSKSLPANEYAEFVSTLRTGDADVVDNLVSLLGHRADLVEGLHTFLNSSGDREVHVAAYEGSGDLFIVRLEDGGGPDMVLEEDAVRAGLAPFLKMKATKRAKANFAKLKNSRCFSAILRENKKQTLLWALRPATKVQQSYRYVHACARVRARMLVRVCCLLRQADGVVV